MKNGYQDHFKKMSSKNLQKAKNFPVQKSKSRTTSPALRPKVRRKKPPRTNYSVISFLLLLLFISAGYLYGPEDFQKMIDKIEISFGPKAGAADKNPEKKKDNQEKSAKTKEGKEEKIADQNSEDKTVNASNLKNWTDEELSHFSKLNERKKQLDHREEQLSKLEEELHKQKNEIEGRIRRLEQLRSQISKVLKDRVQMDQGKVAKLVDFYSNMKPQQAAKIIETINEDLAVEILGQMKKKNAASIMNLIEPNKAQVLSEKFAGYKR